MKLTFKQFLAEGTFTDSEVRYMPGSGRGDYSETPKSMDQRNIEANDRLRATMNEKMYNIAAEIQASIHDNEYIDATDNADKLERMAKGSEHEVLARNLSMVMNKLVGRPGARDLRETALRMLTKFNQRLGPR